MADGTDNVEDRLSCDDSSYSEHNLEVYNSGDGVNSGRVPWHRSVFMYIYISHPFSVKSLYVSRTCTYACLFCQKKELYNS